MKRARKVNSHPSKEPVIQHRSAIKAVLLAASSMTVMAGAIVAPALPGMAAHFPDQSDVLVKLILTMPALMITLFGTAVGYLADRFGRKRLLVGALLLYGITGFSGFLIDDFALLLVSRAALGVTVAGIISLSTTLIGDYFRLDERARFLGLQGSFMALGGVVFLNLGGALAEWSWRGPFLVYLLGAALAPVAAAVLFEPSRPHGMDEAADTGPTDVDRFRTGLVYFLGLVGMALFYMVPAQLPFLLTEHVRVSGFAVGLSVSTATITSAAVSFAYGRIKPYCSVTTLYIAAFLLVGAGYLTVGFADGYWLTTVGVAISGIGFGLFMPNGTVWLMSITPERARGRIIGGFTSVLFLGQFLSPLAVAPLAAWLHSLRDVYLAAAGFAAALAVAVALLAATALRADNRRDARGRASATD